MAFHIALYVKRRAKGKQEQPNSKEKITIVPLVLYMKTKLGVNHNYMVPLDQ